MNKCTIVVSSCDYYEDIWIPFFYLLKRNWKNLNYPIVLNTENKHFSMDGLDITSYSLYKKNEQVSWAKRLIDTLNKIDSEYVIMLLDDYLLESAVNKDVLDKCIQYMDKDPDIASFNFKNQPGPNIDNVDFEGFSLRGKNAPYRTSTQAAIWRKEQLLKYLRPHESAWQFEIWGSVRSRRLPWKLYCSNSGETQVFDYCHGRIIIRGKYYRPDVRRIEKKLNIKLQTEKRGFTDYNLENMPARSLKDTVKHYLQFKTYSDVVKSLI